MITKGTSEASTSVSFWESPRVQNDEAEFDPSGSHIAVKFLSPTNRAGMLNSKCSDLLDGTSTLGTFSVDVSILSLIMCPCCLVYICAGMLQFVLIGIRS